MATIRLSAEDAAKLGYEVPKKRHKYNAVRSTTPDGKVWDSKKEAQRWGQLLLLEKAGKIENLQPKMKFPLRAAVGEATELMIDDLVGYYESDFAYMENGEQVVEDTKGGSATKTPLYRWKRKHLWIQYGIEIREV